MSNSYVNFREIVMNQEVCGDLLRAIWRAYTDGWEDYISFLREPLPVREATEGLNKVVQLVVAKLENHFNDPKSKLIDESYNMIYNQGVEDATKACIALCGQREIVKKGEYQ